MEKNSLPIAVFDSGMGGLSVVSRIMETMPEESIIYFGDTARVPYGSRPATEITRFSLEIADFLLRQNVKALVIACNTIDTTCRKEIEEHANVPVFGILEPAAEAARELYLKAPFKKAAVIATERTVKSKKYDAVIAEKIPGITFYAKACPLFVPLIEEGFLDSDITRLTVAHYLEELTDNGIKALILGCTHYPLIYGAISEFCGEGVTIIDPAESLARTVKAGLEQNGMLNPSKEHKEPSFYLSGLAPKFGNVTKAALGKEHTPSIVSL